MKTLIILSLIYIISALSMYFVIRKLHSKGVKYDEYSLWFLFITNFTPLVNTFIVIILSTYLINSREFLSKFYKIKK